MDGVMVHSERERVHVFAIPQTDRRSGPGDAVELPIAIPAWKMARP